MTEIKTRFHQLLDRITPSYQDRLKNLPPQERALLETIALMRFEQRTPVNIAKKFRKPRHQTSVLLKRMTEAGYLSVSVNPNDKRSRLYRIKEGFFDIWLAMNESRAQRKYLPYLVDFFILWYASVEDRENKRRQLTKKLSKLKEKEQENAMLAWVKVYKIAKKINLARTLDALENLAKNLGLDDGIESWEKLARNDE
ncbi:MAG: helix-turn-helix domain-containing protein [Methylococcaceae bacterium]